MADEATTWVPQMPVRAQAPVYHTRSSSIGWRNNFPFNRRRADSVTDLTAQEQNPVEGMPSTQVQGLRKRGTRAFKRSKTTNDVQLATSAREKQRERSIQAAMPRTRLPSPRNEKLEMPEELSRELTKLSVPQELNLELVKLAAGRKSRSFDDLKRRNYLHSTPISDASIAQHETPDGTALMSSRSCRSPSTSPTSEFRRPPRSSSISKRPTPSGNAWRQEAEATTKVERKNTSPLSAITEFKLPTPPDSPEAASAGVRHEDNSRHEQTVDGVEFEMLSPPAASHKKMDEEDTAPPELPPRPTSPATQPIERTTTEQPSMIYLPASVFRQSSSPSSSEGLFPELEDMMAFSFPAPPPVPQSPPGEGKRTRWTMMSSSRASSIFLPDAFEQPQGSNKVHKRASSESDTMEVEGWNGRIRVPSRPPTPPPKSVGLPVTPAPSAERRKSTKAGAGTDIKSTRLSVPPTCPKGTLPTPRSKFNPYFATNFNTQSTTTIPPVPLSTGARLVAAALKEPESSSVSRSVSLKTKPPSRSPPPIPADLMQRTIKSGARTSPPTRYPSANKSTALKRRSSGSDKDGRQVTCRVKKSTDAGIERSKSQVRRELVKKMALDNIGAIKAAKPTRSPSKNKTEQASEDQTKLPKLETKLELETPLVRRPSKENAPQRPKQGEKSEVSKHSSIALQRFQATEVEKIGSLNAELKRLEEQCDQAKRHQQALNDARKRLQDVPEQPGSPSSSDGSSSPSSSASSDATSQSSGSHRDVVLAQLDKKIEKWRKEVQHTEHRRNRIKKKLAWHSADRLKLIPPRTANPPPSGPLPHRPVSMFSPSSIDTGDYDIITTQLSIPTIAALTVLNKSTSPTAEHYAAETKDEEQHHWSPAPSLDLSLDARPSIDETVPDHPPTPDMESPPLTAANKPWVGLENPFPLTPKAPRRPSTHAESIKSPATVGAGPGRQTIQLFAGEDIMADVARSAEGLPISPAPRFDRQMTIQVFADSGITNNGISELVTALQEEIDNMGRDERWE